MQAADSAEPLVKQTSALRLAPRPAGSPSALKRVVAGGGTSITAPGHDDSIESFIEHEDADDDEPLDDAETLVAAQARRAIGRDGAGSAAASLSASAAGPGQLGASLAPSFTKSVAPRVLLGAVSLPKSAADADIDCFYAPAFADVVRAIFEGKRLRPTQATVTSVRAGADFLHELDKCTAEIVAALTSTMPAAMVGDAVKVPHSALPVQLSRKVVPLELKRLKRAFDKLAAAQPDAPIESIGRRFVEHVNVALREGQ